jgi:hypothetical protein
MEQEKAAGAFVERTCLLFEAGDYPDKGITITEDDLQAIITNSDRAVPVRIEHLEESPFDGVLGMVTDLRAVGRQLWGVLRQPAEAWELVKRAGARSLSVALDVAGKRLLEASYVCHPRVANAQVFRSPCTPTHLPTQKERNREGDDSGGQVVRNTADFTVRLEEGGEQMTGVRQFAEGLAGYLRGFLGQEISGKEAPFAETFARERAQWQEERAERQILDWKRQGLLRATERAETLARTLLMEGESEAVRFDGESVPLSQAFRLFVEANGPVISLGESLPVERFTLARRGETPGGRLAAMAEERAKREGLDYGRALILVTGENPELAMEARGE